MQAKRVWEPGREGFSGQIKSELGCSLSTRARIGIEKKRLHSPYPGWTVAPRLQKEDHRLTLSFPWTEHLTLIPSDYRMFANGWALYVTEHGEEQRKAMQIGGRGDFSEKEISTSLSKKQRVPLMSRQLQPILLMGVCRSSPNLPFRSEPSSASHLQIKAVIQPKFLPLDTRKLQLVHQWKELVCHLFYLREANGWVCLPVLSGPSAESRTHRSLF